MKASAPKQLPFGQALLQSRGGIFGDKVYLCINGKRHYVQSVERLQSYGVRWPEDLRQVSDEILMAFSISGWLPSYFPSHFMPTRIKSSLIMREYLASKLNGIGLEVGAGASPFPVPIGCHVIFGDRIPHEQLIAEAYPGQNRYELVRPDLLTNFATFDGIAAESLDFIVGCHVIEHVFDPIGTLVNAHQRLRHGGILLLVVPDRNRTFDRARPLTTLEHLKLDHKCPDAIRDYEHYDEFYKLAFQTPPDLLRSKVAEEFDRRGDLHVHVWNYETFGAMIDYVNKNLANFSSVISYPALGDVNNDIEFYFVLTK